MCLAAANVAAAAPFVLRERPAGEPVLHPTSEKCWSTNWQVGGLGDALLRPSPKMDTQVQQSAACELTALRSVHIAAYRARCAQAASRAHPARASPGSAAAANPAVAPLCPLTPPSLEEATQVGAALAVSMHPLTAELN